MLTVDEAHAAIGSSPRGRGTPPGGMRRRSARPVHPRAGGEHSHMATRNRRAGGSSPRGRGTLKCSLRRVRVERFIPARAGNTKPLPFKTFAATVHPRAGGEHLIASDPTSSQLGSSPRGRGTPYRSDWTATHDRFIPARAGNTHVWVNALRPLSVHPRAGGEHLSGRRGPIPGSTPSRFIPARAGNTHWSRTRRLCGPVHPRAGGEHLDIFRRGEEHGTKSGISVHPRAGGEHRHRRPLLT